MARVIVDSWMTSPGHRANLLNPDYTHLGVGVSVLGKDIRATQNFVQREISLPRSASAAETRIRCASRPTVGLALGRHDFV